MSKTQTKLVIMMTGLFLLSVTVYKWQAFTHFTWSIIAFKALIPLSLFLFCYGLGRLIRLPVILCLALPVLMEITCWRYIYHVIQANQHALVQNVGILENWINYRDVIQFNRQFSSHSPDLGYTLRPKSQGYHADFEYKNKFTINRAGLRDDDASLENPRIIFLGDSFTMGWGIDQDKTFEHITERRTGVKSLNAGISSYGTFREMLLFKKLQRDSCKVLVIQYCDNDLEENAARTGPDRRGQLLTSEKFEKVAIFNELNEGYYPMRYTYFFVREKDLFKRVLTSPGMVWQDTFDAAASWISGKPLTGNQQHLAKTEAKVREHTEYFFKVVAQIRTFYSGNIVVMHIDGRYTKPQLIDAFEAESKEKGYNRIYFLRIPDLLHTSDYYPVDGHINTSGHQKIAGSLVGLIREQNLLD